jgi:RimJ/RimL family protein N-acetyltransferase
MTATVHPCASTCPSKECNVLANTVPLFNIRVRTARLELRLPHPDELPALAAAAASGIHHPDERPFLAGPDEVSWALLPPQERGMNLISWNLGALSRWKPSKWRLELAAFVDRQPIGVQSIHAEHYAITRQVTTGSWLRLDHHGRGLGTEMREAALTLVFDHLGGEWARTSTFDHNFASNRVSEKLGYQPDGLDVVAKEDGRAHLVRRYRMSKSDWKSTTRPTVEVDCVAEVRSWFGLDSSTS